MSLFRRDTPDPLPAAPPAARRAPQPQGRPGAGSLIAVGTKVTGEVTGSADLTIEGEVEGTLDLSSQVTVAAGGVARGRVTATAVRIAGRVQGDVKGREVVEIATSGSLEGNISAARVVIAEGAFFKGQVEMTGGAKLAPPPSPSPPAHPQPPPPKPP